MAVLPNAIAPWAAFAINLRFLYFDDEWAGTPDPNRGRQRIPFILDHSVIQYERDAR
jgi:hypothetical protein